MSEPLLFGRYALERRLAVGGMAEVHLARIEGPEGFRKQVVVKRLLPQLAHQPELVQMFLREARLAARFHHASLIQVYELFELAGQYAIVMEYLQGVDVAAMMQRALEMSRPVIGDGVVASIVADAAAGLHAAHELRDEAGLPLDVVHRDVSPTNIFVTWQGSVKVVDFGIATTSDALWRTTTSSLRGKVGYMSPEQARGERLDRTSDVFSLGVVLYEMLTQRRCFDSGDPMRTLDMVREGAFLPVTAVRPDTPPELVRILGKMLAFERSERYPTCDAVRRDLMSFVRGVDADPQDLVSLLETLFPRRDQGTLDRAPTAIVDLTPEMLECMAEHLSSTVSDLGPRLTEEPRRRTEILSDDTEARSQPRIPAPTPRRSWRGVVLGVAGLAGIVAALMLLPDERQQEVTEITPVVEEAVVVIDVAPNKAEQRAPKTENREPKTENREPKTENREQRAENREPRKPKLEEPKPKNAFLSLTSSPPMDVSVNGKRVGRTPLDKVKVDPGKLSVQLRDAELGIVRQLKLSAEAGEIVERDVALGQGQLVVDARPWAEVYLGSKKLGTTPLAPLKLYEGTYTLRLVNPSAGKDRRVSVTVQAGQTAKVMETMTP